MKYKNHLALWAWLLCANVAFSHPGIHEQIDELNAKLKKAPTYQLYAQRAHLYYEGSQWQAALKDLDTAAKLGPKEPLLYDYGKIYAAQAQHVKALKFFDQFISTNPRHPEVYQSRARSLKALKRTDDALRDLKMSFELQALPHPGLYIEAANLVYGPKSSDLQAALSLLDQGITRLGVQGQLQERAIDMLMEKKQFSNALERMKSLGDERKQNVYWRYDYAQLLIKANDTRAAQRELNTALLESNHMKNPAVAELRSSIEASLKQLKAH